VDQAANVTANILGCNVLEPDRVAIKDLAAKDLRSLFELFRSS
jgi:hypothetical protein